jgi:hypothetical protein
MKMPNWCFNRLIVDTTNESGKLLAEAFRPKYKDEQGHLYARPFNDLMPIPEELNVESGFFGAGTDKQKEMDAIYAANKAKYGHDSWYSWCVSNWGTKWDARVEDIVDDDPEDVSIYFDTAWSPPTDFLRWFSEQHPDVIFECEYDEEGMSFEGKTSHHPDCGFHDECWELEHTEMEE